MQSRREFLVKMSVLTSGLLLPLSSCVNLKDNLGKILPLRKLGRTGEKVTMLGVGGFHVGEASEAEAQKIIELAIERGIRFFDNAHNYHKGLSETRYGQFLVPKYRDQVFIMTKTGAGDYKSAKQDLERSLSRMKIDQVDLWQMHSLTNPGDVDNRINGGVLKAVEEAIKEGKVRYAGFTCHNSPRAMLRMLEQTKSSGLFSVAQMPINLVDAISNPGFIEHVLPKLIEENIGVLGMKSLADGRFFANKIRNEKEIWKTKLPLIPNYLSVQEAIQFAWSMPISSLMTGAQTADMLSEKINFAERMAEFSEENRKALVEKLTAYPQLEEVQYYKKDRDYLL